MKLFLGMILGVVLVAASVFGYFLSGSAPVSTDAPPMPMEKYLAKKALHAVLDREMPKTVPIPADEANYLAGAQIYKENCAVCHGLPASRRRPLRVACFQNPQRSCRAKA